MSTLGRLWRRYAPNSKPDELLGVSLDTTSICNLRCTTCSLEENYHNSGVMTLETFSRLSVDLASLSQMAFSSSAEPLLNPDLPAMLSQAKQSNNKIATALTTNGTLLDEPLARKLVEFGLDALEFSVDGASEETYAKIRVGAKLGQVLDGVIRLQRLKRQLGAKNPHLSIRFVLHRTNAHELEAMLGLALKLDVRHLVVNGLEPYSSESAKNVLYGSEGCDELEERLLSLAERAAQVGVRVDLPSLSPEPIDDCTLIENSCIVLWDGTVVPCSPLAYDRPFFWLERRHHHSQLSFGNIHDRPLLEIWRSPEYSGWRRSLKKGPVHEECQTCLKRAGVLCPLKHWQWLSTRKHGAWEKVRRTVGGVVNAVVRRGA